MRTNWTNEHLWATGISSYLHSRCMIIKDESELRKQGYALDKISVIIK